MTELLTAAQMRAIEQAAIASGEVTGLELMERAGRGVVEAVFEEWPELAKTSHRAVVLCGPGNNGGDGFVVARLLKQRGWEVEVFLYGDEAKLPVDAAENCRRWREMGEVAVLDNHCISVEKHGLTHFSLVVDALFGTGLSRPFPKFTYLWGCLNMFTGNSVLNPSFTKVVAVDTPSRICSDSGRVLDEGKLNHIAPTSNMTVTFHRMKQGHVLANGPNATLKLVVRDIGLRKSDKVAFNVATGELIESAVLLDEIGVSSICEKISNHKYTHGHALILSGSVGKGGAARLAARGALRIGAGLVTVGCPPAALIENAARLDAVMVRPFKGAEELGEVLQDTRINALCLGPGMGRGEHTREMVGAALAAERGVVLDADALTSFEDDPDALFALLNDECVLTPHAGEFSGLFPDITKKLNTPATKGPAYSKVDATREAAERAGCVVLFKGADTVIAGPDGYCSISSAFYERAAPWLATAGSGDVLAGFITGLLARGFAPMQAAETAAWLHVECAREFGPGLIAEDLAEQLPAVFRALGL